MFHSFQLRVKFTVKSLVLATMVRKEKCHANDYTQILFESFFNSNQLILF